ncbi:C40 family peptidase [Terrabacter sp. NPDC080008]|uniref:C40 family peptidase n=1 Tax=Terrabacter sp. NPDC080008 TaxID=3155176 RepID=UPI00344C1538
MAQNVPGRHRAPGRFSALAELKTIAKESAQPAVKGAAIVAASGGLVASFAGTANAADGSSSVVAAPAAVGPAAGTLTAGNALSAIGFAKPALKQAKAAPVVIEDIAVKTQRAEQKAAEEAATKAAADRQAASQRVSRSAERVALNPAPAADSAPAPAPSASGIVGIAQSLFGIPYVYGGTTPSGFDCSGFTSYVYRQAGISIPRTASAQQAAATRVSSPSPGDLVFFGSPAYHVGIYVSPGRMIDAQRPGTTTGNHSIWTTPSGYGRF